MRADSASLPHSELHIGFKTIHCGGIYNMTGATDQIRAFSDFPPDRAICRRTLLSWVLLCCASQVLRLLQTEGKLLH